MRDSTSSTISIGDRAVCPWFFHERPGGPMDYIIAGLAAALLFVYLIRALFRPERF